ncbi:MAG: PIN domain-containing protein [Verrucomicrobiota bacterium]
MRALLDVSVLVALLDRQHVSHRKALGWIAQNLSDGWASCPLTENGCVRVLTNPKYPTPVGFETALEKLAAAKAGERHEFWPMTYQSPTTAISREQHFKGISRLRTFISSPLPFVEEGAS